MLQEQWVPLAGVVVTLAFFVLVGYLARTLRTTRRLAVVLMSIGVLVGALPPVITVLYDGMGSTL